MKKDKCKCKFCGEYHNPKKEDYKKIMEILDEEMERRAEKI